MAHFCNNATDSFGHMQIMATTFTFGFGSNQFLFFSGQGFFYFLFFNLIIDKVLNFVRN